MLGFQAQPQYPSLLLPHRVRDLNSQKISSSNSVSRCDFPGETSVPSYVFTQSHTHRSIDASNSHLSAVLITRICKFSLRHGIAPGGKQVPNQIINSKQIKNICRSLFSKLYFLCDHLLLDLRGRKIFQSAPRFNSDSEVCICFSKNKIYAYLQDLLTIQETSKLFLITQMLLNLGGCVGNGWLSFSLPSGGRSPIGKLILNETLKEFKVILSAFNTWRGMTSPEPGFGAHSWASCC